MDVPPEMFERWLEQGGAVLIDIREDFEYGAERIPSAHHFALSRFDPDAVRQMLGACVPPQAQGSVAA